MRRIPLRNITNSAEIQTLEALNTKHYITPPHSIKHYYLTLSFTVPRIHTCARVHTHTHTRARARAHTHTHTHTRTHARTLFFFRCSCWQIQKPETKKEHREFLSVFIEKLDVAQHVWHQCQLPLLHPLSENSVGQTCIQDADCITSKCQSTCSKYRSHSMHTGPSKHTQLV